MEPLSLQELELNVNAPVQSLAGIWAKKYVEKLDSQDEQLFWEAKAPPMRRLTAEKLSQSLRTASSQAWAKTEILLAREIKRHGIDPELIDPWAIAQDSHRIYRKALAGYAEQAPPQRLSVLIGSDVGRLRHKYTAQDPRVIGFVSMQFHYSGQILLQQLSASEQPLVNSYFKVIDDHLYMPLQRAYEAAAAHNEHSPTLRAVQQLLPVSSEIARSICQRVAQLYANYRCYSGVLPHPSVQISSIRDVEMFQIYLCVCVLEGSVAAIQQELFPLCVMLYPTLQVSWELVRQMLHLLGQEITHRLQQEHAKTFEPYFKVLWEMFSPAVLPEG